MPLTKEAHAAWVLAEYHRRREHGIATLGGECVRCHSVSDLEFDHIDPKTKSFPLSHMWSVSRARFLAELAKCQLLCRPCHIEKTRQDQQRGKGFRQHGTWAMVNREKCTCPTCRAFKNKHMREYKARQRRNIQGSTDGDAAGP